MIPRVIKWQLIRVVSAGFMVFIAAGESCAAKLLPNTATEVYRNCPVCQKIYARYTSRNIVRLENANELPQKILQTKSPTLFIVPRGVVELDAPLELAPGQAILPEKISATDFITLTPSESFYSGYPARVLSLSEGSGVASIAIRADGFKKADDRFWKEVSTLVLVKSAKKFDATRLHLEGTTGMTFLFWNDASKVDVASASEIQHSLTQSYINGRDAGAAVFFELRSRIPNPDNRDMFDLKHLVVTVGGVPASRTKEVAIRIQNGKGKLEHTHLGFLKDSGHDASSWRELMRIHDANVAIKGNMFFSLQGEFRERDVITEVETVEVETVFAYENLNLDYVANSITSNAKAFTFTGVTGPIPGRVDSNYLHNDSTLVLPSPEEFFSNNAQVGKRGPGAGVCLADINFLKNVTVSAGGYFNSSDVTERYCGRTWNVGDVTFSPWGGMNISSKPYHEPTRGHQNVHNVAPYISTIAIASTLSLIYSAVFVRALIIMRDRGVTLREFFLNQ